MEENPFPGLNIQDSSFLNEINERSLCPKCNRKRKYYCPTCYTPIGGIDDKIPNVKIPVKVHVIKHKNEKDGKSTAVHAAILAPQDVTIYTYPTIPDYSDKSQLILVFPEGNSTNLLDLINCANVTTDSNSNVNYEHSFEYDLQKTTTKTEQDDHDAPKCKKWKADDARDNSSLLKCKKIPFHTVVFIDSTWDQSTKIFSDDRLKGIKTVHMNDRITKFWRPQTGKPDTYLATIEAIYYFLCDLYNFTNSDQYCGQYDNLLFFFNFIYKKISNLVKNGKFTKLNKVHNSNN